jgi:SAM-dependent methyltransferase
VDFAKISESLSYREGIWVGSNQTEISYPKDGNSDFAKIEDISFWFIHRNKCIQFLIKKFPPAGFLLDIGGGNGYVSKGIMETGVCEVALLEPGMNGILNAKKRGVENLINSTLQDAKIKTNSLPAAGLFDVLEHIKDDNKFLNELNELLSTGGYLFITVPTYSLLWSKDDEVAGHFRRYTLGDLKKRLEQSNFEICFASYFFMFLIFPIFFLKSLPDMFFKNKSHNDSVNNNHAPSIGRSFIDLILIFELFLLKKNIHLPFGSSCIVIAKKK